MGPEIKVSDIEDWQTEAHFVKLRGSDIETANIIMELVHLQLIIFYINWTIEKAGNCVVLFSNPTFGTSSPR